MFTLLNSQPTDGNKPILHYCSAPFPAAAAASFRLGQLDQGEAVRQLYTTRTRTACVARLASGFASVKVRPSGAAFVTEA